MEAKLKVKLLRYTENPEETVAAAAKLTHSKSNASELLRNLTKENKEKLLKLLTKLGHLSPFEHASFTFTIEGVSRALTHQLVRHRIASYSQQSQRFVSSEDFLYVIPPTLKKSKEGMEKFKEAMNYTNKAYKELKEVVPKEDARYVLPNATETKIMVTMNARGLRHFFKLRLAKSAQWEIRNLASEMLKECKKVAPLLFENIGEND